MLLGTGKKCIIDLINVSTKCKVTEPVILTSQQVRAQGIKVKLDDLSQSQKLYGGGGEN